MNGGIIKKLLVTIICGLFIGCAIAPLQKTVIRQSPLEVNSKSKSIAVSTIVDTVPQRTVVGKAYGGTACLPHGELYWNGQERMLTDFSNSLRDKLDKMGYSLVGKAYSPFNDEYNKQADLLLGGKITDIQSNACYSVAGVKGEFFIRVTWELFDTQMKKIILSLPTEGYSASSEFMKTSDRDFYVKAFDMATDNLLAEKSFYDSLMGGQRSTEGSVTTQPTGK